LNVFIARELVQSGNGQVGFQKPVAGTCGLELVIGKNLKGQVEAPALFSLFSSERISTRYYLTLIALDNDLFDFKASVILAMPVFTPVVFPFL
jgi:hypothetical protein